MSTEKKLVDLVQSLRVLRSLDDRMQLQTAITLLLVMRFAPCRMASLRSMAGLSQASISRNCAALGKIHRHGQPGLGLIQTEEDIMDRKHKIVTLTPKGRNVMNLLANSEATLDFLKDEEHR